MFVGHYGVSFAGKRAAQGVSLATLFLAVQLLDVVWSILVIAGVEKVRIVPGITKTNPLDLYYMPYTHSLVAALLWSLAAFIAYRIVAKSSNRSALVVGVAVFSHWVLDLIVHRPDLPLYDDTSKVGLGLWNYPAAALLLEALLLFGGLAAYLRVWPRRRVAFAIFGLIMLGIQVYVFFGPPPASPRAAAATALVAYFLFAGIAGILDRPKT
jgi:membrane-bound metal-dependent hydrolase YbcI (DUF457 family)